MKHLMMLSMLGLSVTLAACGGGESDSSGSTATSNTMPIPSSSDIAVYESRFSFLPKCQVDTVNKIIYAGRYVADSGYINPVSVEYTPQECKVQVPELNGGYVFSLRCNSYTAKYVAIRGLQSKIDQIQKTVETGQPYLVTCSK